MSKYEKIVCLKFVICCIEFIWISLAIIIAFCNGEEWVTSREYLVYFVYAGGFQMMFLPIIFRALNKCMIKAYHEEKGES